MNYKITQKFKNKYCDETILCSCVACTWLDIAKAKIAPQKTLIWFNMVWRLLQFFLSQQFTILSFGFLSDKKDCQKLQ